MTELKEMSIYDLQALKKKWFDTAIVNGKLDILKKIARHLGKCIQAVMQDDEYFYMDEIYISMTPKNTIVKISMNDGHHYKTVVDIQRGLYVEGEWEKKIFNDSLIKRAMEKEEAYYRKKQEELQSELVRQLS